MNIRLSQNYKMGGGLFFPINNKVVEVKKIHGLFCYVRGGVIL